MPPASFAALARFALASGDPYLAIPIYPFAESEMAAKLEAIILTKPRHRLVFAAMPFIPARLLERLAEEPDVHVARRLAANPGTPAEIRRRLRARWPDDARMRVRSPAMPASSHPERRALNKRALARRAGLSAEEAALLSADRDSWVRRWLGRNPSVPVEILARLAADADLQVRRAVGRNPSCPQHLIAILARDAAPWVRAAIAFRDDVPPELIAALADDSDPDVLSGLGRNPASPLELLARIAASDDPDIRRSVILNRGAPGALLEILLDDPYPLNRALLAIHPGLSEDAAWSLVGDPEPQVRYRAMARAVKSCMRTEAGSGFLPAVIPAKAGTHLSAAEPAETWVPAFAGMTG
jgi:hypothetical protein